MRYDAAGGRPGEWSGAGTWTRYDVRDGLMQYPTRLIATREGVLWATGIHDSTAATARFDGARWERQTHPKLSFSISRHAVFESSDGALWFGAQERVPDAGMEGGVLRYDGKAWRHYTPDAKLPETEITVAPETVSQPGNTTLTWAGADPWRDTPDGELQYAWRLDGGGWSPFSNEMHKTLLALSGGDHTFEVKARDRDFNEDPAPARVQFTVVPPVWQQPWFIAMVILFAAAVGVQTGRVIRRDRRLREANTALSSANKELFGLSTTSQRCLRGRRSI